jgi:subtilase family serine protease
MSAYHLPTGTSRKTVAIVDAFGYPTAEADLAMYRRTFGLPACTVASGCLRIVNQDGAPGPLPDGDFGWALESALDLQAASAACPTCGLLLVEGNDNSLEALAAATDTAVRLGASVVSNSYGTDENNGLQTFEASYNNHPGVPILASSGDFGFGIPSWPAVLPNVIAVGGTTLNRAGNRRGWTEQAWSGAGSGCSAWYDKPAWQRDPNCQMRTTADISAVADPDTGLAVYDTFDIDPSNAWLIVGGTSAASPFVAGLIAATGHPERVTGRTIYAKPASAFYDAVGGSNGFCGGDYLCTGLPGYDAPTGRGTPNGLAAFR